LVTILCIYGFQTNTNSVLLWPRIYIVLRSLAWPTNQIICVYQSVWILKIKLFFIKLYIWGTHYQKILLFLKSRLIFKVRLRPVCMCLWRYCWGGDGRYIFYQRRCIIHKHMDPTLYLSGEKNSKIDPCVDHVLYKSGKPWTIFCRYILNE
jgi:hypothetical protein